MLSLPLQAFTVEWKLKVSCLSQAKAVCHDLILQEAMVELENAQVALCSHAVVLSNAPLITPKKVV
jgi:hypothetical protein